jgi:thiamine-phosphate pyrophosphorylase
MASADRPQITLITPPALDLELFPDRLAAVLDAVPIACLRLSLVSRDEDAILRAADACRQIAYQRDVAVVIESHLLMVRRLGLDGVHLADGARSVRAARKELGADAIVGAFCGTTRHEGISAGEAGADYAAFGPVGQSALGKGEVAAFDLFEWWSEMIEVPCIAEGGLSRDLVETLAPVTDFFAVGEEVWKHDDASAALRALMAPLL